MIYRINCKNIFDPILNKQILNNDVKKLYEVRSGDYEKIKLILPDDYTVILIYDDETYLTIYTVTNEIITQIEQINIMQFINKFITLIENVELFK